MREIILVAETGADIPQELAKRYNIQIVRDPIKSCVNDKKRQYENHRLSQEWKYEPIQEGVEET